MTLDEALSNLGKKRTIKNKNVCEYFQDQKETIPQFYNDFISIRLINDIVVKQWNELLMKYTEKNGATFFIRCANTDKNLKRGWMQRYSCGNESFNIVFADNDLAVMFYKLALDGFVPDLDEFYKHMTTFKYKKDLRWYTGSKKLANQFDSKHSCERKFLDFPVHFQKSRSYESDKNSAVISGPNCCIGSLGYKHSHIFNAGKDFWINDGLRSMSYINNEFFSIGDINEYLWDSTISNYVKTCGITEKEEFNRLKQIAIATTLRFINPVNYFLSPKTGRNIYIDAKDHFYKNDIAEYDVLISYIYCQKAKTYNSSGLFDKMLISSEKLKEIEALYGKYEKEKLNVMYFGEHNTRGNVKTKSTSSDKKGTCSSSKKKKGFFSGGATEEEKTEFTKDFSTFEFDGKQYNKSHLASAIIKKQ